MIKIDKTHKNYLTNLTRNQVYINEGEAYQLYMRDDQNYKWTKKEIAQQYSHENPNWSWSKCWEHAILIHKELKRLNNELWHNNKVFFKYNTPFSFYDNKDGEFSDIPWDGKLNL